MGEQPAQGGDATTVVSDRSEASDPRRTPEESTVGLMPGTARPADSSEGDVPALRLGETLVGRFTVVRFIAHGGMGAVYEANDGVLRTRVALKLIRRLIASDGVAMERFRREVLLARQVGHPNVCRVYELYEATTASGEPIQFLTMELLSGETLAQKLVREGTVSTAEALPLVKQMCAGLAAAHAEGVVHRDFKSSNVMLVPKAEGSGESTGGTRVVITDFGVARATSAPADDDRLTGEAGVLGTSAYIAPEQVTGREVTPATDIYALGVVLYEMVTGTLPFRGDKPLAAAARPVIEAPPGTELTASGLDPRWSRTIVRCLAREPSRRFQSAFDVADALSSPVRGRGRAAVIGGLASLFLLVGAAAVAWAFPRLHRKEPAVAAVPAVRPVAAILGFLNRLPEKRLGWLPTALEEGIHRELATAETVLRVLPTDRVAKARRSLGIGESALSEASHRTRLQSLLVAHRLIHGELGPAESGSSTVKVRVHLLDASTGRELAELSEDLGPDAVALPEGLMRLGSKLRDALHAPLSPEEASVLASTRMKGLEAAQLYAEGVLSLRAFEYEQARSFFESALTHEATLVDAQRRVVESLQKQGSRKKTREATERLASQKHLLTSRQSVALVAEGVEGRVALFNTRPDDEELGFETAFNGAPAKLELALIQRLRQLPPPLSDDLRLDAAEAEAVFGDDPKRAHELLDRLVLRARQLGARSEEALGHDVRASLLWGSPEEVPRFREAIRLRSEIGDLEGVAQSTGALANALAHHGHVRETLGALDEAAGAFRRLGNRWRLHQLLAASAMQYMALGDAEVAWKQLEGARAEAEVLGEPPGDAYLFIKPKFFLWNADLSSFRAALHTWRGDRGSDDPMVWEYEAMGLTAQDQLEEARALMKRAASKLEKSGQVVFAAAAMLGACELECEQGHPAEGLACMAALSKEHDEGDAKDARNLLEARCKYLSNDAFGAEAAARRALTDSTREWFMSRVQVEIEIARAMAAGGQTAKAIPELKRILAEVESRRFYKKLAFEAALALGEAEVAAGLSAGRPRLVRLQQEARSREFFLIARQSREALDRHPPPKRH
jgi:tRNA A-37 threonylcarbamoyl transferase component Bud32/tetratricopeptide (TPR) repeat protein